ncbi:MAG TPA: hypothetical protein PK108_15600 [Pyrinomonadaceae bacterium]|nr:hypothetical protein [Pyrinomonadaceae bacterium]
MNDKLQNKLRAAEEQAAEEMVSERLDDFRQEDRDRALFILGGINIADRVAESLGSEAIKAMINFQEQQLYLALGYRTFVDFLANSEFTRMTRQQFYDRKNLLEKEGDATFDLLTELGISIRKRKLLGKGNVELDGEILVVHDGDVTTEIAITDRSAIFDAITALADSNSEKSIKLDRQKEKLDKHDEKVRELYDDIDRIKAAKIAEVAGNPHMIARVELGLAFTRLAEAAAKLSAIEKDQFRDGVLQDVAEWRLALASGYATDTSKASAPVTIVGDSLDDALENFLDNVDLDDVADNNDGELAAAL